MALIVDKNEDFMSVDLQDERSEEYGFLLKHRKWQSKRANILKRDNYTCTKCGIPGSTWIPSSNAPGGSHIIIIENDPVTEYPKEIRSEKKILQVHHTYYLIENQELIDPWEYDDEALITVCHECHDKIHREEVIRVFERSELELIETPAYTVCSRCDGKGFLGQYSHVQGGLCFKCDGKGILYKMKIH